MPKLLVLLIALAACGSKDKCERATDKLAPLMEAAGKNVSRDQAIAECRKDLEKNPKRECMLDCILSLEGEITGQTIIKCANTDKFCKVGEPTRP